MNIDAQIKPTQFLTIENLTLNNKKRMKTLIMCFIISIITCLGIRVNAKDMEKTKFGLKTKNYISKNNISQKQSNGVKYYYIYIKHSLFVCLATDIMICNNGWCEEGFMVACADTYENAGKKLDVAKMIMSCPQCFQF